MQWARIIVILPIGKLFDSIFNNAVIAAAKELGIECSRIEPEFSSPGALGAICEKMESADLIVADITARNPNVLYLAGYAHGIGREVLFLTQQGEDFPFDRAKHPPIIYGHNGEFLRTELRTFLSRDKKERSQAPADAREQFLATFGDLLERHQHEHQGEVRLETPTTYVLVDQDMDLALVQDLARRARELGLRIKLM